MSLESDLIQHIEKFRFSVALDLLKSNPSIDINWLDADGCSFLMATVEGGGLDRTARRALIEYILSRPDFEHVNKPVNGTKETPLQTALMKESLDLTTWLLDARGSTKMEVVFDGKELLYDQMLIVIQDTKAKFAQNPADRRLVRDFVKENGILDSLLLAAVEEACKTSDSTILHMLANSGADFHRPLQNGKFLVEYIKQKEIETYRDAFIKEKVLEPHVNEPWFEKFMRDKEKDLLTFIKGQPQLSIRGFYNAYCKNPGMFRPITQAQPAQAAQPTQASAVSAAPAPPPRPVATTAEPVQRSPQLSFFDRVVRLFKSSEDTAKQQPPVRK